MTLYASLRFVHRCFFQHFIWLGIMTVHCRTERFPCFCKCRKRINLQNIVNSNGLFRYCWVFWENVTIWPESYCGWQTEKFATFQINSHVFHTGGEQNSRQFSLVTDNWLNNRNQLPHIYRGVVISYIVFHLLQTGPKFSCCAIPAGTHLVPKTSPRQRFQNVQNVDSEDGHKT